MRDSGCDGLRGTHGDGGAASIMDLGDGQVNLPMNGAATSEIVKLVRIRKRVDEIKTYESVNLGRLGLLPRSIETPRPVILFPIVIGTCLHSSFVFIVSHCEAIIREKGGI